LDICFCFLVGLDSSFDWIQCYDCICCILLWFQFNSSISWVTNSVALLLGFCYVRMMLVEKHVRGCGLLLCIS